MNEPEPLYTAYTATVKGDYAFTDESLEHVERKLIDALKTLWRIQGKRRKIVKIGE